jgi:hypothetical protein
MRVLVCGSRHFKDRVLLDKTLKGINITELIHGCARGADSLAGEFAEANDIPQHRYPALWDLHGKRAGPIRNYQMLREGKPDLVVGFLFENSRGTKHMLDIARKAGIETLVINCE